MLSSLSEPAMKSLNQIALAFDIETGNLSDQAEPIEQVLEYMASHIQLRKLELIFMVSGDQELPALSDMFNLEDISMQWVRALIKNKGLQILDVKIYDSYTLEFNQTRMQWRQDLLSCLAPIMLKDTSVRQETSKHQQS